MPTITLPDGSTRSYDAPTTALAVATDIGERLAKACVGCLIDGTLADLSTPLDKDCTLHLVTEKTRDKQDDPNALELLRHSTAHVMAEAIQRIVAVAHDNGIKAALHCGTPDYAARGVAWGYDMVTIGADSVILAQGAAALTKNFRNLVG